MAGKGVNEGLTREEQGYCARTRGRRDAVQGGAVLSGEQLHGGDEGGCIGAEVGEEEGQRVHHDEQPDGHRLDLLDRCCQDDQDGGHDGETCTMTHHMSTPALLGSRLGSDDPMPEKYATAAAVS